MESGEITLYAHYADKDDIDVNNLYIDVTPQVVFYNRGSQNFTLKFTTDDRPTDNFEIQYKLYGVSGAEYVESVSDVGVYTVKVTRSACETYKYYEQTIDAAFEIRKAPRTSPVPVPQIIIPSMTDYSVTVVPIQEQDDYGNMMYAVNEFNVIPTDENAWTTSCTIIVPTDYSGRVYVFAKLLGGEFYEDTYSNGTSVLLPWGVNNDSCYIECEVTIGEVDYGYGVTHGEVQGHVTTIYGDMELSGFYGALTEGTVITLEPMPTFIFEVFEPWEITGVELWIEGRSTEDSEVESIMLSVAGVDYTVATNVSVDHNWPYTVECEVDIKRIIDNVGAFETWGRVCDVDDLPALLELTYDGEAVDQYTKFSDFSYDVGYPEMGGVPYITIELADGADEIIFGHCFWYSNYELTIDTGRLKYTMEDEGVDHVTFTATLIFPESYTAGQRVWTQTITITMEEIMVGG